jgi:hypothetical protein
VFQQLPGQFRRLHRRHVQPVPGEGRRVPRHRGGESEVAVPGLGPEQADFFQLRGQLPVVLLVLQAR